MSDLLTPVPGIHTHEFHPSFKSLIGEEAYAPARELLLEVWRRFPDPDSHFIRECQTAGFDARIWELVVAAVGLFGPYTVSRPHVSPDFLFERDGVRAWIEVTTAGRSRLSDALDSPPTGMLEQHRLIGDVIPIRLGSALFSKLQRNYSKLPHVEGQPLVLAVSDFGQDGPMRFTASSLVEYVYGLRHTVVSLPGEPVRLELVKIDAHRHGDKVIPSGFFDQPGAESISAIVFSNDGTLPKFNRLGFDRSRHPMVRMARFGVMQDFDPAAVVPVPFLYLVGDEEEDWGHGVSVFFNPHASHPLPLDFFQGFGGRHWMDGAEYHNLLRDFYPHASLTLTCPTAGFGGDVDAAERYVMRQAEYALRGWAGVAEEVALLPWADKFL